MLEEANLDDILAGLVDYHDLDPRGKFKFDGLMASFITFMESAVIAQGARLMPDEKLEALAAYMRPRFFAYPGAVQWWAISRHAYIGKAQNWVDEQIANSQNEDDFWGIISTDEN